jgi:hypothetical protein
MTKRELRQVGPFLNWMVKIEAKGLVDKMLSDPAIQKRRGLVRMLERGEYAAAGRSIYQLEVDGSKGDEAARGAAERYGRALEALRERTIGGGGENDYHLEAAPVLAFPTFEDLIRSPIPRGRRRSDSRDWGWVEGYAKSRLRSISSPLSFSEERERWPGIRPRDLRFIFDLFEMTETNFREGLKSFDLSLARLRVDRMEPSEALEFLKRSSPFSHGEPGSPDWLQSPAFELPVPKGDIEIVRKRVFESKETATIRRGSYLLRGALDFIERESQAVSIPQPVLQSLREFALAVARTFSRQTLLSRLPT